ncbi:Pycsar system effector family protein [Ligilactobacillus acidipiscis]|uniref:Pycsar system effector family protein n=1 Tax=Ligilactobacillus acidipiscis TaxID=89059 RepID=UPI0023F7398B|nr:Pycsar system effector family protein [Ligilactobacillus acidipiscis]WEV56529.1 DUF5706 domain-containing protein [Ligilactobacillus acidipiscis]
MNNEMNVNELNKILNLQLTWIREADTKASIFLSAIGILLAFSLESHFFDILVQELELLFKVNKFSGVVIVIVIIISFCYIAKGAISFYSTLMPRVEGKVKNDSKIYFKTVSELDISTYKKSFLSSEYSYTNDLLEQIYNNASIANQKMTLCSRGIQKTFIGFSILLLVEVIAFISHLI